MTENQIKAKILITGRALERADWRSMKAEAAHKWCELYARFAGCHDPAELERIATGAMLYVMEGGSSAPHPGEALDEAEIEADAPPDRWEARA